MVNSGVRTVRRSSLVKLAEALGLSLDDLLRQIGVDERVVTDGLAPAESEMVERFRALSPVEQAKVLLAFDEAVNRVRSSHDSPPK